MNEGSLWPGDKDFEFEAFPRILAANVCRSATENFDFSLTCPCIFLASCCYFLGELVAGFSSSANVN